jgi:hypothetical protein
LFACGPRNAPHSSAKLTRYWPRRFASSVPTWAVGVGNGCSRPSRGSSARCWPALRVDEHLRSLSRIGVRPALGAASSRARCPRGQSGWQRMLALFAWKFEPLLAGASRSPYATAHVGSRSAFLSTRVALGRTRNLRVDLSTAPDASASNNRAKYPTGAADRVHTPAPESEALRSRIRNWLVERKTEYGVLQNAQRVWACHPRRMRRRPTGRAQDPTGAADRAHTLGRERRCPTTGRLQIDLSIRAPHDFVRPHRDRTLSPRLD